MIWLASFPRSGNTFFRNVLFEVYGLESSTWHIDANYPLEPDYDQYPVVKTHLLPNQLVPSDPSHKKVYIVRDGRDALVSIAHHRKDIVEPGTDFYVNLLEATLAMEGSYFGGWSENVKQWVAESDILIRFEDLIENPIREVEKLRSIMDLPEPNLERLPTFETLKHGKPHYGSGKKILGEDEAANMAKVNFRKGKSGGWKEEMPPELEQLFWELHHEQMEAMGYGRAKGQNDEFEASGNRQDWPYRILIEGNKTEDPHMDGVRRYLEELISGLVAFQRRQPDKWRIDVLTMGRIIPVIQYHYKISARREVERESFGIRRPLELNLKSLFYASMGLMRKTLPDNVYNAIISRAYPLRYLVRWILGESVQEKYQKAWDVAANSHQLVHVPLPQNYYFVDKLALLKVFTVHDMTHRICPQFHDQANITLAEKGMAYIASQADAVINVSKSTQNDVLEQFPHLKDRTHIIYEAANADLFAYKGDQETWARVKSRYGIPEKPYFISLSTIEPRKNLKHIVEGFFMMIAQSNDEEVQLVVCGRKGWKHEHLFKENHPFAHRVHFTGHVLDDDLPWLYSRAVALCYIPHYEGFGLPPLEAMLCRTPILYGNNSAMPEIVGDAGLALEVTNVDDIASQMTRIYKDKILRDQLSQKALVRAHHFSWLKTAFQTLSVYEQTIEKNRTSLESKSERHVNPPPIL